MAAAVFVLALVAGVGWAPAAPTAAQQAVAIRQTQAVNDFPRGIEFTLTASVPQGLREARLRYNIAPDGSDATVVADCEGDTEVSCRTRIGDTRSTLLIPGSQVTWSWDVRDSAGDEQRTDPQVAIYQDDRFDWKTVSDGNLTVWYHADEEEARQVLEAGRAALDDMGALLKTTVPFPVKVFLYRTAEEMRPAIVAGPSGSVVTLGEVLYSDTAMVSSDYSPREIARHELTHVVIRQAVKGPFSLPDWLDEGTAVFAQSQPLPDEKSALDDAIAANRVFSVRSLSSATVGARGANVNLFYGQAWSLVKFLVDTYGEGKFAELFATFKAGSRTGDALRAVYGFDEDGLENAWRASVGLPPRQGSAGEVQSTPVVVGGDGRQETAPATPREPSSGGGFPLAAVVAVAVLAGAVLALTAAAGVLLARRLG